MVVDVVSRPNTTKWAMLSNVMNSKTPIAY
jgi:hypothetical protein